MCVTVHLHEITENYKNRPILYSVLLPEISIENIESQTSAFQLQYFRIIPIGTADCAFDSYSPQDGSEFQNSKLLKSKKKKKIFFQRKKYNHLKSFIFRFLRAVMSVPTCKLFHPTSGPSFQFFFKRFEIAIQLNLSFSPTTSRQGISLTKVWNMLFFISQLVLPTLLFFIRKAYYYQYIYRGNGYVFSSSSIQSSKSESRACCILSYICRYRYRYQQSVILQIFHEHIQLRHQIQ